MSVDQLGCLLLLTEDQVIISRARKAKLFTMALTLVGHGHVATLLEGD